MQDTVELSGDDNGRRLDLPPGATLVVRLAGQPGTGYTWQVSRTPANLTLLGAEQEGGGRLPGGTSMQVFRFRAEGAGTGEVELSYRRPWEKDAAPLSQFRATVAVVG